jgi:5-methylcytosine-specific restriction endonuclease McrA
MEQLYEPTPPTRPPEFYLERHLRRQGLGGPGGGKPERFARISRYVRISVMDVVTAHPGNDLPSFVRNEFFWTQFVGGVGGIILCSYCNRNLRDFPSHERTEDHVHPRFLGGSDMGRENLVPACGPCNRAKANDPLIIFLSRRREGTLSRRPGSNYPTEE